jgi:endoglucanase
LFLSRKATWGEEDAIISEFKKMKEKFVNKGVPVVLGEYAIFRRTASSKFVHKDLDMHNKSVDYWTTYITK